MDCSPPGSSVHGILQAGILKWVASPFSRGSSWSRDQSWVSCIAGRFFTIWATREVCSNIISHYYRSAHGVSHQVLVALLDILQRLKDEQLAQTSTAVKWQSQDLNSNSKMGSPGGANGKETPLLMQETHETRVSSLGREDPLEKEMATHSSILAWKIPWTEEPGGLQSTGSQRAGHDWSDLACTRANSKTHSLCYRDSSVYSPLWIYTLVVSEH